MIETIVSASVLIAVVILLRYGFRGKIRWRLLYALWLLVAIRLLLPFSLCASSLSVLNVADIENAATGISAWTANPAAMPSLSNPATSDGNDLHTTPAIADPANTDSDGISSGTAPYLTWPKILTAIWLTGAVAIGIWFLAQNFLFYRRLRKTRQPLEWPASKLPVYFSPAIASPCLFGIFRPAIYLTADSLADTQSGQYILAHEETHYYHGDHIWSYLRCICLALHWFNPLVWWAATLSRRDCELACDEGALRRLGNEHRKAYGNTLINMIAGRTKPADLLCGATTMTSGKSGIKERIAMIAKKPQMLLSALVVLILLLLLAAGCTFTGANQEQETVALTEEELAYFNGGEFFNGEAYPNIRNQFLSSLYDSPEQIDLFQLFYCGSGLDESISEQELAEVIAANGWETDPDCQCTKNSAANMDAVLDAYMGLTLEKTAGVGLDQFTYLAPYDAYYYYHGDTNYRSTISFFRGERQGDLIRLYYDDTFMADGNKVLTLREKKGSYLFVANQMAEDTAASVTDPEGVIAADIEAPAAVLTAAKNYVRQNYQYWYGSSGAYAKVDGEIQSIGAPAVYDNWRIEGLARVYTYTDLNGQPFSDFQQTGDTVWQALDIYRLDYRIHTLTPEKVVLAGGMDLDEDGWLLPTYPESTYLYVAIINGEPQYLFMMMENDCFPGNEGFTNDLINRLTMAKEAQTAALGYLRGLFADGETVIWYEAAHKDRTPAAIPEEHAYTRGENEPNEARYEVLFNRVWLPDTSYPFAYPDGAYLCLGDSAKACFQFFLGSNLVLWREGEQITAWRVGDNLNSGTVADGNAYSLPAAMMLEFSGYEINPANVELKAKKQEAAADTVNRFLAAYGEQLLNLSPESINYLTGFQVLDITKIETKDNRILLWFELAVQPPENLYQATFWWPGNSSAGEGELAGWLVMSREMVIEQTEGVWHCTDFGTGGASL